jgi:uncharacterized protein (UPF0261 family)
VVRTNHEEIKKMARIVADLANRTKGPLRILVPLNGFSAFDSPQGPLPDPQAPELFAQVLQENLSDQTSLKLLPHHINDPEFSRVIIEAFDDLLPK